MTSKRPGVLTEAALLAPTGLFTLVSKIRGALYDFGILKAHKAPVAVVSIGNLSAGGTGKTPITSYLAHAITERGVTCGIVSRGYGGTEKGPSLVDQDGKAETALRFGDEPSWLAAKHPEVPIVIAGDRVAAAKELFDQQRVQVILADDGFQHRRLARDIDIVIVDATEPRWHYRPLPLGRMREGFSALSRARLVFISKTNQAEASHLAWLRFQVARAQKRSQKRSREAGGGFEIVEFETSLGGFVPMAKNLPDRKGDALKVGKVVLMSAIARPALFEKMVKESTGAVVAKHFEFRDHHVFTDDDLSQTEAAALAAGADAIIVTEKDATKLEGWRPKVPCYVSRLIAQPIAGSDSERALGEFYETIDRLIR